MASNKTPNLGMDIWSETDYFKRAELNSNFTKLDTKAKENSDKIGDLSQSVTVQLAEKVTKEELNSLGQLKLSGVYDTLPALQSALPTGASGLFLITADGFTYRWTGSSWNKAAQFQSTGIADKTITSNKTTFIEASANLFNKNDSNIVTGKYIKSDGTIVSLSSLFYTGHIEVEKGVKYIIPKSTSIGDLSSGGYYDSSGNFVTNVNGVSTADGLYRIITVPQNDSIKTMKVNYENANIGTFMVVKGEVYPSQYSSFYKSLSKEFSFNDTQKSEFNPLNKKIVSYNGDSISAGAGFAGGYGKIIADRNAMVYENRSVSGGTIASGTYKTDGTTARHWICRDIANMRNDADYIILEGSVNDVSLSVPLGTITSDFTSTFDDATFCGAFESMLKQAVLRFPGKKIGFVIVHRLWMDASSYNFHNGYYPAIKQMCEKWSIPYCDLYKGVPSLNLIPELKTAYTKDGDGWHPNEVGYKKFYCDKIEAWMKTL